MNKGRGVARFGTDISNGLYSLPKTGEKTTEKLGNLLRKACQKIVEKRKIEGKFSSIECRKLGRNRGKTDSEKFGTEKRDNREA